MYMQSSPARSDRLCGESQVTQARDSLELAKRDWSDHSSSRCPPELATIRVRIHQKCTAVIPTLSPVPTAREKSSQPGGLLGRIPGDSPAGPRVGRPGGTRSIVGPTCVDAARTRLSEAVSPRH